MLELLQSTLLLIDHFGLFGITISFPSLTKEQITHLPHLFIPFLSLCGYIGAGAGTLALIK